MGGFPTSFFAFPLNLILLAGWILGCSLLWSHCRKSLIVRFFLSTTGTIFSVSAFLIVCLVIGFTGNRDIASSWVFVCIMLLLQTVLLFVIMRGWREQTATGARLGAVRWRFLLLHLGLLVALGSAFWGAPDVQTLRMKAVADIPIREAYQMDGNQEWLSYDIVLKDFDQSSYEALVEVDGKVAKIKVNHPYSRTLCEDVYLMGYDERGCVLEIVREPWKYGTMAGIAMLLAGALLLFFRGPQRQRRVND